MFGEALTGTHLFNDWLRKFLETSSNSIVRNSEVYTNDLLRLNSRLPERYTWLVTSKEDIVKQLEKTKNANARETYDRINSIYWQDFARIIEAYGVLIVWRGAELAKSAVNSLNVREVLVPAVISRSLLELATTGIDNSNTIEKTVHDIVETAKTIKGIMTCADLELLLNRVIYGTRMDNPPEWQKQKNVLTYLQRVSEHPGASKLTPTYDYLCDIAHPNLLGNARFWKSEEARKTAKGTQLPMERLAESEFTNEVRVNILWALGWSSACISSSYQLTQKTVASILGKWPID